MPKLAPRCNNRRGQAQLVYGSGPLLVAPVAFSAPPRKVSFEDGHRDAASSSSDDDESSLPQQQLSSDRASNGFTALAIPALQDEAFSRPLSGLRRKSTLIRPTTSQCLVALASLDEDDDDAQIESNTSNKRCRVELIRTDAPSPTQVFVELAVPVSPGPQDMNGSYSSSCSGVSTPPVSPWGHFVDIVVASEEQQPKGRSHSAGALLSSSNKCHHTHHDGRFNCCTSCRRRHAGPYGGVCNKKHTSSSMSSPERRPLCFLQNDNDIRPLFPTTMSSKGSRTTFKLQPSPRKDYEQPTEQLITALHHMRVD
jgi:hypothetical protein